MDEELIKSILKSLTYIETAVANLAHESGAVGVQAIKTSLEEMSEVRKERLVLQKGWEEIHVSP